MEVLLDVLRSLREARLGLENPEFSTLPRLQIASLLAGRGEAHDLSGVSYCADKATAIIDVRYPPPFEPHDVTDSIEAALRPARERHSTAEITIEHPPDPAFRVGGTDMPPMDVPTGSSYATLRRFSPPFRTSGSRKPAWLCRTRTAETTRPTSVEPA